MDIARRLRTARLARGYNQRFLAEKAGLSIAYVNRVERSLDVAKDEASSIDHPTLDSISKLARALEAPVPWLAFGDGPDPDWVTAFLTRRPASEPPEGSDGSGVAQ